METTETTIQAGCQVSRRGDSDGRCRGIESYWERGGRYHRLRFLLVLVVALPCGFIIPLSDHGRSVFPGFAGQDTVLGGLRAESPEGLAQGAESAWNIERRFGQTMFDVAGETLRADIYLPRGDGPFPGVLMIHGGAWVSGSRLHLLAHANAVARAGYTVVSVDYRLAPRHHFPAQLDDCRAALNWMRDQKVTLRLDPERIALYGYSAGGHLACLLGYSTGGRDGSDTEPVQAIVAGGAPCDFQWVPPDSRALAAVFGATRREAPHRYRDASPLHTASSTAPPTLLYHGESDRLVPLETSRRMHERLQELGVSSRFVVVDSQGHLATFVDPAAPQRALEFLAPILQPPSPPSATDVPTGSGESPGDARGHDDTPDAPLPSVDTSPTPGD